MTVRSAKPTIGGFASPIVVFFAGNLGRPANLKCEPIEASACNLCVLTCCPCRRFTTQCPNQDSWES